MGRHRILILGGTTESRQLAADLAQRADCETVLSLAGRTTEPRAQPVTTRTGGFGGSEGLADYLIAESIDLVIDATHPFAARISANAAAASARTGVPLFALQRPAWERQTGDRWTRVAAIDEAVDALGIVPRTVFLAIGRQEAHLFESAPQHRYIIRSVDPLSPPLNLADARYILATGPFAQNEEEALLTGDAIDVVVTKNSGGTATYGKIAAARKLGIEVIMVERRKAADVRSVDTVRDALTLLDQLLSPEMKRGV